MIHIFIQIGRLVIVFDDFQVASYQEMPKYTKQKVQSDFNYVRLVLD